MQILHNPIWALLKCVKDHYKGKFTHNKMYDGRRGDVYTKPFIFPDDKICTMLKNKFKYKWLTLDVLGEWVSMGIQQNKLMKVILIPIYLLKISFLRGSTFSDVVQTNKMNHYKLF